MSHASLQASLTFGNSQPKGAITVLQWQNKSERCNGAVNDPNITVAE